ncbi:MAG: peptide ABC transporter substrate-binding protein [Firmicutes bacterium HGW-Firmicutes-7]|nr:MAG: peptide ABC transporter substrate-binding protein [Firmicutes bacterium HGW-Firmicutes-7]
MKKVIVFLMMMVMIVATFSGCGKKEEAVEGKYLRIAQEVDLPSMDQHVATDGLSFEVIAATIEGLYSVDKDGTFIPAIAKSYEVSEDQLTYTFTLRDDVKWSNGDAVTAADFVFSWRRLLSPEQASEYNFIGGVAGILNADKVVAGEVPGEELGVVAQDDTTLVVTLDRPVPYFLSLTAFSTFFPLNEKFVTEKGADYASSPENLLANGPYKMATWDKGYGFRLDKNPDYYDATNVTIAGLDYRVMKDNQTATLEYDSGNQDVVKLAAELVDKYKDNEEYTQIESGYLWYITPNNQTEVFSNVNVRKAFQHAINKQQIVDKILNDGSNVANFIIPIGLATGPDGKDFRESAGTYSEYDVALAQEYWTAAKAELGDTIEIEFLFDDDGTVKKTAEFIQAELETNLPGIKVSLKAQPKKNRLDLMTAGDYEVGITRWGPDYADPLTYLELYLTGATLNYPNYENAAYDVLVDDSGKGKLAGDAQGRWDAMIEAERIFLEDDAGITPLFQSGYAFLINPKVTGIESHAVGVPFIYKNVKIAD